MFMLVKYCLSYFFLKKRLTAVFKAYLLETGTVSTSIVRKRIVLKNYNSHAIKGMTTVLDYLNSSYPFFKIDKITYTPYRIILSQSPLPLSFRLPEAYIPKPGLIPIACDENKNIIHIDTKSTSSTGVFLPSGSGKTYFLMSVLQTAQRYKYYGFNVALWDPKLDGDYDFLESDNFKIIRSMEEAVEFHRFLRESIESGTNSKWLIVAEEYLQWTDPSKYKNSKEKKEISLELQSSLETAMQLYRSKGVHTLLVCQTPSLVAQTVNPSNISNKIYGYLTPAQAQTLNIPEILQNRGDLIKGKFIMSVNNKPFILIRGVSHDQP